MRFKLVFFILEARERQEMERSRTIQGFPLCNQRSQLYIRSVFKHSFYLFFLFFWVIYRDFSLGEEAMDVVDGEVGHKWIQIAAKLGLRTETSFTAPMAQNRVQRKIEFLSLLS